MNVQKTQVVRISRRLSTVQVMTDLKQMENVEYFNYLGSMITTDRRCTRDITSWIAMA